MKPAAATNAKPAATSKIDLTWANENSPCWVMLPEDISNLEKPACARSVIVKLIDDETAQVKIGDSKDVVTMKGDKIYPLNDYRDYPDGYDDMVDMENLSEAELLNNLYVRFSKDMIYTYVGPTLIVLNPYKRIERLLLPTIIQKFQSSLLEGKFEPKEHMPHVYAIAAMTMKNLFENKKNQAIVISGESGAGKTENTKSAMKFLTSLGKSDIKEGEENIEDKILACNPVLEAFGNAKTVRNDNSSRFGKYVSLLVEKDSRKIIGATITNYLLEKSRVVGQISEERNYHIFYAFLRGASEETLKKYFLTNNLEDWAFLKNAFKGIVKTVPDPELYKEVCDSFRTMNFSEMEQHVVWTYTAVALQAGNIDFDESTFSDKTPCTIKNDTYLKNISKILEVDYDKLAHALTHRTRVVINDIIHSPLKKEECLIFRDSLAKDIFNKLFNWLVRRLNFTVMPPEFVKNGLDMTSLLNKYYHIGLLDIFGFEIFDFNSLEQFCINFANEKLQQLYIAYVFKGEEKEFINEGLKDFIGELSFKDNQALLELMDGAKTPGIFQSLDESCSVNATDQNLYDKMVKAYKKPELAFTTPKIAKDTFIIKHTAKDVEYNINGFRAKNKDEISKPIEDTICASANKEIGRVWKCLCLNEVESEEAKNAKPNPKDKFLGYKFRTQMKELMEELNSCECHFIRCLKPNEKKRADFFAPQLTLLQIKYMGVLDTIKVRKDSFPVRTAYKSFYEKYQELDKKASKTPFEKYVEQGADFKAMAKKIIDDKVGHLGTKQILFGNNKLFLRVEASKEIEKMRRDWINLKHRSAKKIQRRWFYFKHIRVFRAMVKGTKVVQKLFRISKEYLKFIKLRKKTRQIQLWWKRVLHKRLMEKMKKSAVIIQKWWKMKFHKARYQKILTNSKTINRLIRGGLARKKVRTLKLCIAMVQEIINRGATELFEKVKIHAAKIIQRYARGFIVRQKYAEEVEQIKRAKRDFIKNKMARKLQKIAKGFMARKGYERLKKAATFIQGHMKMMWLSTLFQQLRVSSVKIQKAVKRWYIRRKMIKERMNTFLCGEGKMYKSLQFAEQIGFFGAQNISKTGKTLDNKAFESVTETPRGGDASQFTSVNTNTEAWPNYNQNQSFFLNATKEVDPYASKKIQLITRIIDMDILSDTSLFYEPMWSQQVLQLQKDGSAYDTDLSAIEVGQAHTVTIPTNGKVLSFGWNDRYQLGRPTQPDEHISRCGQIGFGNGFRPKSIASGDDHSVILDNQGGLYIWGDNSKGQQGLGHCRESDRITNLDFTGNDQIQEVKAKGENTLAVTQNGKAYYWPIQTASGERIYKPTELFMPPKIQVATASCGYNFAALVTKNGLLFTFGRDNQAGQLGHGDLLPRESPTVVEAFRAEGEMIVSVSCGFKHVICKSKVNKVYTWGWGKQGQLGHGEPLQNETKPKLLSLGANAPKSKVLQVQAGFKHCVLVLEKKIYWWGTNASLESQSVPIEINLQKKIPSFHKDFTPLKVLCSWSRTMNITYMVLADPRALDLNIAMKQKVVSNLLNKLEETSTFNDAGIPYVASLAQYFPSKIMKNTTQAQSGTTRTNFLPENNGSPTKSPTSPQQLGISNITKVNESSATLSIPGVPKYGDTLRKVRESTILDQSPIKNTEPRMSLPAGQLIGLKSANRGSISPTRKSVNNNSILNNLASQVEERQASPSAKQRASRVISPVRKSVVEKEVSPVRKSVLQKTDATRKSVLQKDNSPRKGSVATKDEQLDDLSLKLMEIKKKMQDIMKTPMDKWNKKDAEFMKMATEPRMLELLQSLKI